MNDTLVVKTIETNFADNIVQWLLKLGINQSTADVLSWLILGAAVVIVSVIIHRIANKIMAVSAARIAKRSKTRWDDFLIEHKVFTRISHIAPAIIIYYSAYLFPGAESIIQRLSMIYIILASVWVINSFLNAVVNIYNTYEISRQRPIKGYVQVAKIIIAIIVVIFAIATLLNQKVGPLLTGLGAMTAVIILVFKDTILGLVASVQLSSNDMVRIGDWIEMPKYGADGDVVDITLHTVKVQNWDKTISTIPAYALVTDSFKNWRGMSEAGGRRIKRPIYIDMNTIKFCDERMLNKFEKIYLIKDYVKGKRQEIEKYNREHEYDSSLMINGRNMTNIGTFRAYVTEYLKQHPKANLNLTYMVRQLKPTEHGLPLEIYVFSKDRVWVNYEKIQSDIFDHILAVVPEFELRLFQRPSGRDFKEMASSMGRSGDENSQE